MNTLDLNKIPSPAYVIDETLLENNLKILADVQDAANIKIIHAIKAFSMFSVFDLIAEYLPGSTTSGLYEALLAHEHFPGETHVYSPAYSDDEFCKILPIASHISFNSLNQYQRLKPLLLAVEKQPSLGLRINPEHQETRTRKYDPCAPCSRLGMTRKQFDKQSADFQGLQGLHFHTLCEQDSHAFERTLIAFEQKFADILPNLKWLNCGGGHMITRKDYDRNHLITVLKTFKQKYPNLQIYLEPGQAIAHNAGVFIATVRDIVHNEIDIAILDTSATAHMPDVLEMPYRPEIIGPIQGYPANEKQNTYRLAGLTCLAGDVIGDYSFDKPLNIGDKLIFADMAIYTMVKNTTFNGMPLPAIVVHNSETNFTRTVKEFSYDDFKNRLS